jgi:hypothetical protein
MVVVANSVSPAHLLKEEPVALLKAGRGHARQMSWCALAVNVLCNNGRAVLTAGQYVVNAQQTRSKTMFYHLVVAGKTIDNLSAVRHTISNFHFVA